MPVQKLLNWLIIC